MCVLQTEVTTHLNGVTVSLSMNEGREKPGPGLGIACALSLNCLEGRALTRVLLCTKVN